MGNHTQSFNYYRAFFVCAAALEIAVSITASFYLSSNYPLFGLMFPLIVVVAMPTFYTNDFLSKRQALLKKAGFMEVATFGPLAVVIYIMGILGTITAKVAFILETMVLLRLFLTSTITAIIVFYVPQRKID